MKTTDTIVIKAVSHKSTDELDFVMRDDILGKGWDDDDDVFAHEININQDLSRSVPIKIDDLRKLLDKLEKEGCNYVSVDYHRDHIEYDLYGFDIRPATEKQIEDFNAEEKRKKIEKNKVLLEKIEKEKEKLIKQIEEDGN